MDDGDELIVLRVVTVDMSGKMKLNRSRFLSEIC